MTNIPAGMVPCPRCNGTPVKRVSRDGEAIRFRCSDCGAETGLGYIKAEAVAGWNTQPDHPVGRMAAPGVTEALSALVTALDRVHADPRYDGVWMIALMHQGPYAGPTYTAELDAARDALAAIRDTTGGRG